MISASRTVRPASQPYFARQPVEAGIEIAEEAMHRLFPPSLLMLLLVRLEQQRAHRRRQRQRHDQRDHGRARDGERELPVELAGNAGDEGGRNEHRAQHERDRDQRAADLVHRLDRGVARTKAPLDIALDILDHDDRVVDHDADREHQSEQRQIVERESEQAHHEEGADQRDRNRDDRDHRRPPGLQEQHDDENDEDRPPRRWSRSPRRPTAG